MTRRTRGPRFEEWDLDDSGVSPSPEPETRWQLRSASASDAGVDREGDEPEGGAPLSERGARRVYGALCVIASAAGRPGPAAREQLDEFREFLGLSEAGARLVERQAQRGAGTLRIGKRPAELAFLMGAMIDVAAADGVVSRVARGLIARVNERARWSDDRVADAIEAAVARAHPARDLDDVEPAATDSGLFEATLLPSAARVRARTSTSSVDRDPLDAALDDLDGASLDEPRSTDSGLFEATLLPSSARARRPVELDDPLDAAFERLDDPLDAAFEDLDGPLDLADGGEARAGRTHHTDEPPARSRASLGLEDTGEVDLVVHGSPWFDEA